LTGSAELFEEAALPDCIFDTSAFINGWNHHYRLPVFQGVWDALGIAMGSGRIVAPSEVLFELAKKAGDPLHKWAAQWPAAFIAPEASWLPHFVTLRGLAPHWFTGAGRHEADPFVVAMALAEGLPIVTYEGQAFSGDPAKVATAKRSMPIICAAVSCPCSPWPTS
jgi:hypothetical protein